MINGAPMQPPPAEGQPSLTLSIFENAGASNCEGVTITWPELTGKLQEPPTAAEKSKLPWLKLARFGDRRTEKNSLRHDANVIEVFGVEGDYDGMIVSPAEAIMLLERAHMKALVYTSPSHSEEHPRWRVLAPLSHAYAPAAREALVARMNGALGGILAGESFTLSQSYYFGRVPGLGYQCRTTFDDPDEGLYLDVLDELDDIAIGRPRHTGPASKGERNSAWENAAEKVQVLGRKLVTGDGRRELLKSYIGSRSVRGFSRAEIRALVDAFGAQFFDPADAPDDNDINSIIEWAANRDDIRRQENAALTAGLLAKSQESAKSTLRSRLSPEDIQALQKQPPMIQIKNAAPIAVQAFPVEVLNDAWRWISTYRKHTHPLLSQAAILSAVSAAGGRRYLGHGGRPTSLYLSLLTNSAPESGYALHAAEQMLLQAGLRSGLRSHRFTSPQQIYTLLNRSASVLYCPDDYGVQVQLARRQPSGSLEQIMSLLAGRLREGATLSLEWSDLGVKQPPSSAAQCVIYAPSVTMLASVAGSQIAQAFKRSELSRGALGSMIFVPAMNDEEWIDRQANAVIRPPAAVLDRLRLLRGIPQGHTELPSDALLQSMSGTEPSPVAVRFTGHLDSTTQSLMEKYRRNGRDVQSLARAAGENIERVAAVVAMAANPEAPVATEEIIRWAHYFVGCCLEATIAEYEMLGGGEEKSSAYDSVIEIISRYQSTGITRRQLAQFSHAFRSMETAKRHALLDQMVEDGTVFEVPSISGRTKTLVHRRFIESPDEVQIVQRTAEKGISTL